MRTSKMYSLSNFQVYYTILLTKVITLCITFPEFSHPITGSWYCLTTFTHLPTLPLPPSPLLNVI